MAFSFGQTPAPSPFGAASTPAFGAASAPAFGAAASTPAFSFGGAAFGAPTAAAPAFGQSSTPAFSFAAPAASPFGAAAAPASPFGGGALQPFGAAQAQAQPQHPAAALTTKDGQPVAHATRWEDLSPQAQAYLLELEKVVASHREDCRALDEDPRLAGGAAAAAGGGAAGAEEEAEARALSRAAAALGAAVAADAEDAAVLREAVLHLLRAVEGAVFAFKRNVAWREAARAGAGAPAPLAEQLGAPVALPSPFLRDAIAGFEARLRHHRAAAAELEASLALDAARRGARGAPPGAAGDPTPLLQALHAALANAHGCLMATAARLQELDERVARAREAHLARRGGGAGPDPFEEAEAEDRPAGGRALSGGGGGGGGAAAARPGGGGAPPPTGATGFTLASAPGFGGGGAPAAASPSGLFGTATPGVFSTPVAGLFDATGSKKKGRR